MITACDVHNFICIQNNVTNVWNYMSMNNNMHAYGVLCNREIIELCWTVIFTLMNTNYIPTVITIYSVKKVILNRLHYNLQINALNVINLQSISSVHG